MWPHLRAPLHPQSQLVADLPQQHIIPAGQSCHQQAVAGTGGIGKRLDLEGRKIRQAWKYRQAGKLTREMGGRSTGEGWWGGLGRCWAGFAIPSVLPSQQGRQGWAQVCVTTVFWIFDPIMLARRLWHIKCQDRFTIHKQCISV